jgi:hypothetical protein
MTPTPLSPPERIGFVGLGQMGAPMVRNLARAGFKLAVADANAQAVARFGAEAECEAPATLAGQDARAGLRARGPRHRAGRRAGVRRGEEGGRRLALVHDGWRRGDDRARASFNDLRTALELAHATGTPAPLGEACVEAWARAEQLLGGQADHTAVVKYWERLAGSEIKGG